MFSLSLFHSPPPQSVQGQKRTFIRIVSFLCLIYNAGSMVIWHLSVRLCSHCTGQVLAPFQKLLRYSVNKN